MNVLELKNALAESGVTPDRYRLLEAPDDNTWCLRRQGKAWLVFYFERGTKRDLQRFKVESIACEYFYNKLVHG
ncbi:hypothetical protein ABZ297_29380 [Nonomuraea sp. NPDC005983]|uniref:hypothetical protein n=1 Tax=Nonomuraea sp. NPDC005983 TaxID=3155595 RepID=UPI0033BFAEFF